MFGLSKRYLVYFPKPMKWLGADGRLTTDRTSAVEFKNRKSAELIGGLAGVINLYDMTVVEVRE